MQTCPHPSFVTCEIHSVYAAPRAMTCVPPASNTGLRDVGNPVRGVRGAAGGGAGERGECGRGIRVCRRWSGRDGFAHFLEDMGERREGTTLDRKNAFLGYSPENCRWATAEVQSQNQRRFYVDGQPPEAASAEPL